MEALQAGFRDDWLLDSLEKYEGIYIFELQYPTSCLEWNQDGSAVWLACASGSSSSEILQLALPERLLPAESQTLWAKRDFKLINGAFTKSSITSIKFNVASQCVISGNSGGEVQVWASDKETNADVLQEIDAMKLVNPEPNSRLLLDVSPTHPTFVLCAFTSSLCSLQLIDLPSRKPVYTPSGYYPPGAGDSPLHCAGFLGEHQLITCSGRGHLQTWDFRDSASTPVASTATPTPTPSATPTNVPPTILYSLARGAPHDLALLDSTGRLELFDSRKMQHPLASCCMLSRDKPLATPAGKYLSGRESSLPTPCVQYCPSDGHTLSVSGVGAGVKVYNTVTWSCDMEGAPPPAVFCHDGHEAESSGAGVMVHSWQPGVKGATVLSVDSHANLHAWQWNMTQKRHLD